MDRRKKGEYIGALGALLVHVAVIALLILVSFTVPQPDEDAGGIPVMMGNVDAARGFDDPSLVDVDVLDEEACSAPAGTPFGTGFVDADRRRNRHSETEDGGAQEGNGKTERSSETEKACEEAGEDRGRESGGSETPG